MRQLWGMCEDGSGVESISDGEGGSGRTSIRVGRESSNATLMIEMMMEAREGSRVVMKDNFSSETLMERNAQKEIVDEIDLRGMEALVRAEVS